MIGIPSPASPAAQVASVASAAPAAFTGGDTFTFSPAIGGDPAGSTPPAVSPQAAEILTLATAAASAMHIDVADVHVLAFAHDVAIQGAVVDPLHGFMIH